MELAPIVLFVYNRPWHTRQTLEALSKNELADSSELYVFADGPKKDATPEDLCDIEEVRSIVKEKQWCKEVKLIESHFNKGIEESTISGVTRIVNDHGRIIVLEDDLVTSAYFLRFMNEGLDLYNETKSIYCINGYMFPIKTDLLQSVLLPFTSSWGWATWKDRWDEFENIMDQKDFIINNQFLSSRFNLADYKYTKILNLNTWDIRWYYTLFIRNGLGVFPTLSLIRNIGFDGTGVHYTEKADVFQFLSERRIAVNFERVVNLEFYGKYLIFFLIRREQFIPRLFKRIIRKLTYIKKFL